MEAKLRPRRMVLALAEEMKAIHISAISGLIWSIVPMLLLQSENTFGRLSDLIWVSPVIGVLVGVLVYYLSKWTYKKRKITIALWTVPSLYLAVGLFGAVLGVIDLLHHARTESESILSIFQTPIAFWWGVTFVPVLWLLFPLSFLNHLIIKKYERFC